MDVKLNDRITFTGYPSHLRGKKGTVVKHSKIFPDLFLIYFDDGWTILIGKEHFIVHREEVVKDG